MHVAQPDKSLDEQSSRSGHAKATIPEGGDVTRVFGVCEKANGVKGLV